MAYIEPNSTIKICNNIPFDNTYRHTILFDSISEQSTYFADKTKYTLANYSYQRVNKGLMRVQVKADNLYDCNYMCFQNTNFGTKWFYAFILSVEYVNNETSEITFVIDELQTWMFEMEIKQCMVEREHVNSDKVGENTTREDIPVGEYIISKQTTKTYGRGVLLQVHTSNEEDEGDIVNGVFSAVDSFTYSEGAIDHLKSLVRQFAYSAPEKIANIQMCSDSMIGEEGFGTPVAKEEDFTITLDLIFQQYNKDNPVASGGKTYIPQNNKLYTFPYCYFMCDNFCGNSEEYHYEDFYDYMHPIMRIHSTPLPVPVLSCAPYNYKYFDPSSPSTDGSFSNLFGIQYDDFPLCAWTNSTFKEWVSVAKNKALISTGTMIATTAISLGASSAIQASNIGARLSTTLATAKIGSYARNTANSNALRELNNMTTGNIATGGITALEAGSSLLSFAVDYDYHKQHSTSMGGKFASGVNFELGNIGFRFTQYTVRPEYAERIDNYFTMFGYKIDKLKQPNIRGRKFFNYVKCYNALVTGNIPNNSKTLIENVLNMGVTFWHTTDVGNYNVVNSII